MTGFSHFPDAGLSSAPWQGSIAAVAPPRTGKTCHARRSIPTGTPTRRPASSRNHGSAAGSGRLAVGRGAQPRRRGEWADSIRNAAVACCPACQGDYSGRSGPAGSCGPAADDRAAGCNDGAAMGGRATAGPPTRPGTPRHSAARGWPQSRELKAPTCRLRALPMPSSCSRRRCWTRAISGRRSPPRAGFALAIGPAAQHLKAGADEIDAPAWPSPSWRAKARHPRLCRSQQGKPRMP